MEGARSELREVVRLCRESLFTAVEYTMHPTGWVIKMAHPLPHGELWGSGQSPEVFLLDPAK